MSKLYLVLKKTFSFIATATFAACIVFQPAQAFEQSRSAECIAPANPGGGWDFTCRNVGKVLTDLGYITGNVQTINMPGASGGVAFAHTVSKRYNDSSVFVAASTATATRLAQGQFIGMNQNMVRWVATLGADYGVIAVAKDSPYQSLTDLMNALKANPSSVKFGGGSATGGWDHLKILIASRAAGISNTKLPKIKYLAFNGGGEALTQVVGGHLDAFSGDISEVQGFMESGDLRVLAVLSEERLPAPLNNIPTAREQNIDAVAPNWRGFYVPKGISDAAYQWWIDALNNVYSSKNWKEIMLKNGLMPFHKSGAEFEQFVHDQINSIKEISTEIGLIK